MADKQGEIMLSLPADKDYVLLARMVLSGLGMLAGMDVGLIDDLFSESAPGGVRAAMQQELTETPGS